MSERLEDIKDRFVKYEYDYNLNGEDVEWLIKQAERVTTLEKLREEDSTYYNELLIKLREQNQRYREAMISALSEIEYALYSNKSQKVKEHYLKNAERYINEVLEESK